MQKNRSFPEITIFRFLKPPQHKYVKVRKKNFLKLFTLIVTMIILLGAVKQVNGQDPLFSQFYANPLYLNPALAGSDKCTRFIMNYRNQPYPAFGTFSSYSFSADTYVDMLSGGIGIQVMHDTQNGLLDFTKAGLFYAYHGRISREWYVSFGIQTSYINHRLNWDNLVFPDQFNPLTGNIINTSAEVSPSVLSTHNIDFSSGIVFYNDNFYSGLSVHHLTQPTTEFFEGEKLPVKYTLHLGYEFSQGGRSARRNIQEGVSFSPNLIIQSQAGFHRLNYGMYASLEPVIAGVWFRQSFTHPNSLIFLLGLKQVNYTISYSYDHSLSGFSGMGGGAHELGVSLNLNCGGQITKYRILNCPPF